MGEKLTDIHSSFESFISSVSSTSEYVEDTNVTYLYNLLLGGINGYSFSNDFLYLLSEFSDSVLDGVTTNIYYAQEIIDISVELNSSIISVSKNIESSESLKMFTQIGSVTSQLITLLEDLDSDGADEGSLFLNDIEDDDDNDDDADDDKMKSSTESSTDSSTESSKESSKEGSTKSSTESSIKSSKESSTESSKESSEESSTESSTDEPEFKESDKKNEKEKEK